MKYVVKSRVVAWAGDGEGESYVVTETTRTDRRTAQEDVQIIQDIFHRKAWIEEQQ